MERWMISEVWRELKDVAREVGALGKVLLPWLPGVVVSVFVVDRFAAAGAAGIVLIVPYFRRVLRGGRMPKLFQWLMFAAIAYASVGLLPVAAPAWILGPSLLIGALVLNRLL